MLTYKEQPADTALIVKPLSDLTIPMYVKNVRVTGWVHDAVIDPPDRLILYASHNGSEGVCRLERGDVNKVSAQTGVFYSNDKAIMPFPHEEAEQNSLPRWVNYILGRCTRIFRDTE